MTDKKSRVGIVVPICELLELEIGMDAFTATTTWN